MENEITVSPNPDRTWIMLCHLSSLAGFAFPFGHIVGPLILWLAKKDEDPEVREHGRQALNFQITLTFVIIALFVLAGAAGLYLAYKGFTLNSFQTAPQIIGSVLVPIAIIALTIFAFVISGVWNLAFVFVNTVRAYDGKSASYWPLIPFIRCSKGKS